MSSGSYLMILDDDPQIRTFYRTVAEGLGFRVHDSDRYLDFCAAYEAEVPDVILLDLTMPNTDGIEFLRDLARRECRSAIVLSSGQDEKLVASAFRLGEALQLNMVANLAKPATLDQLERTLCQFLPEETG
ncbi:MAG: response regulator [Alphaproteobacteria bacterium]|nr:response regulator [Alphaproteobacteria bacterium]